MNRNVSSCPEKKPESAKAQHYTTYCSLFGGERRHVEVFAPSVQILNSLNEIRAGVSAKLPKTERNFHATSIHNIAAAANRMFPDERIACHKVDQCLQQLSFH